MDPLTEKTTIRFLAFSDDKDVEKEAKLKEAARKIEQAIAKEKSLNELIDYKPPTVESVDLANDTRPLYERLLEQRNKKQQELEESQKLSNLVAKLDEEDVAHLNEVARAKKEEELRKRLEVFDALEAKKRYDASRVTEEDSKRKNCLVNIKSSGSCSSIKSRISSMIKVKSKSKNDHHSVTASFEPKRSSDNEPLESDDQAGNRAKKTQRAAGEKSSCDTRDEGASQGGSEDVKRRKTSDEPSRQPPGDEKVESANEREECLCSRKDIMQCIGVLPSLPTVKKFVDSSDSDNSDGEIHQQMFKSRSRSRH